MRDKETLGSRLIAACVWLRIASMLKNKMSLVSLSDKKGLAHTTSSVNCHEL